MSAVITVNLNECLQDQKVSVHFIFASKLIYFLLRIVAQVALDKLSNVKTVVNKLHEIDSVYRNFELEILAGEPNTIVKCRESKAIFQFDFAKVYWNPRLSIII